MTVAKGVTTPGKINGGQVASTAVSLPTGGTIIADATVSINASNVDGKTDVRCDLDIAGLPEARATTTVERGADTWESFASLPLTGIETNLSAGTYIVSVSCSATGAGASVLPDGRITALGIPD